MPLDPDQREHPQESPVHCVVRFPAQWINASRFEWALRNSCGPHDPNSFEVTFKFPCGCKVMVDAAIRLLSGAPGGPHDLIITIGPKDDQKTLNAHLASQIGQAVSGANAAIPLR